MVETWEEFEKRGEERRRLWKELTPEARLDLALALLKRENPKSDGVQMLRKLYVNAPESMLDTASWHAFKELPRAAIDLLAELELALRHPDPHFYAGIGVDALYHFYNLFQFGSLLPHGKEGLEELVYEVKYCLEHDDREGALKNLEALEHKLSASESAPDID